jgi:hypothetical protein
MTMQYGACALNAAYASLQVRMDMHTLDHPYACARTHLEICNTVFPWDQWLRERASLLRYSYIAFLVAH